MRRLLALVIMLVPSLALAQTYKVEITPTVGFRWGGGITVDNEAFRHDPTCSTCGPEGKVGVDIGSGGAYGLRVGFALAPDIRLELMADRQSTQLVDKQGLFGEIPGGFVKPGDKGILDVEVTYYHAGIAWDFGTGPNRGFLVASAGVTHINPMLPLPNDTRPSVSVGGGLKMDFTEQFGMRFEARYFFTDTNASKQATYHFGARDCIGTCSYTYSYKNSMSQVEVSTGFAFRF